MRRIIFSLWICLSFSVATFAQKGGVSEQDYNALVAFYHATGGEEWKNNTNWLSNQDIATWHGVTVKDSRVVSICLINNGLRNNFPSKALSKLDNLEDLNLTSNELTGSVDKALAKLNKLRLLYLGSNKLSGLDNMTKLLAQDCYIDLTGNELQFGDLERYKGNRNVNVGFQKKISSVKIGKLEEGQKLKLKVEVVGKANLYQWYKDNTKIEGATKATYIIDSYSEKDAGRYTCYIKNSDVSGVTLTSQELFLGVELPVYTSLAFGQDR